MASNFPHSVSCLFILLMISLAMQKLFGVVPFVYCLLLFPLLIPPILNCHWPFCGLEVFPFRACAPPICLNVASLYPPQLYNFYSASLWVVLSESCNLVVIFLFKKFLYFNVYAITVVPIFPPLSPSTQPHPTPSGNPLTIVPVFGSGINILVNPFSFHPVPPPLL